MAYVIAALERRGEDWLARDVDIDVAGDLNGLADVLRGIAVGGGPLLLLLEREDEWFSIVRVDGDEDPRVFVSDAAAAAASSYAEMLGAEVLDEELAAEPTGDFDLLADLGTSPERLRALCDGELAATTGEALTAIGEAAGFDEVLEGVR